MTKKQGQQLRALFIKNLHIQKRQPCTNCCQILTPIICLIFTILIRNVAIEKLTTSNDTIYGIFPQFALKFNDYSLLDAYASKYFDREKSQWFLYQIKQPADRQFIGKRPGNIPHSGTGLLSHIPDTSYSYQFYNISKNSFNYENLIPPVFREPNKSMNQQLFERFELLNQQSHSTIRHTQTTMNLPDSAITFIKANKTYLEVNLRIKDIRQLEYYRFNGITGLKMRIDQNSSFGYYFIIPQGYLTMVNMLNSAFLKNTTGNTLTSGYIYLPLRQQGSVFIDMLINTVAAILFPLSLSLLLPVFLYFIVLEKQQKLIQMMRMNGMGMLSYWTMSFLYNLFISLLTNLVFCVFGYIFLESSFFRKTNLAVLTVILLGWILSQIGISMLFQVFISNSRAANIIGYLVSIWTNLIGATLSLALFQYPVQLPKYFCLWPTFSFDRLFYLMFTYCSSDQCIASFDNFTPEMWRCLYSLYGSWILFSLLGMYLFQIIPQQYGVSQPVLFPIYYLIECCRKKKLQFNNRESISQQLKSLHDDTIELQYKGIRALNNVDQKALVCCNLTKVYPNGKIAVQNFNLSISDNIIFGLLGPNGAGKTTLLSMITGVFAPTKGQAYVGGYNITQQIDKAHLQMGVCPQFDIIWPVLSVQQHLYFYARLKGIKSTQVSARVNQALAEVNLEKQKNYLVSQLSGGMKRRLSVGISLVGNPRIVFLDEPTTGLDPQNRRHLWEVLSKCRQKRSIFLTTHLMEEAEALCDKIGIITNGSIRTVGDQFQLKELYGKGYFVSISVEMDRRKANSQLLLNSQDEQQKSYRVNNNESIMSSISHTKNKEEVDSLEIVNNKKIETLKNKLLRIFPQATVQKEINGLVKFSLGDAKVSEVLQNLKQLQEEMIPFEWAISNSTLQDVFLEVVTRFQKVDKPSLLDSLNEQQK